MQTIGRAFRASPQTWEENFFGIVKGLMVTESNAVPENVWTKIIKDEEARNVWIDCFTHYSVNIERNYELKETFGDKLMSSALYYLFLGNPQDQKLGAVVRSSNPSDLMTQINKALTSKTFLRKMFFEKMNGLHEYIRCREEFAGQTDIMEDVFESLVAAIQMSVDKVSWEGKFLGPGFISVTKFMHWFYTNRLSADEFDISGKKDAKTFMKNFLEKFYRYTTGSTEVVSDEVNQERNYTIKLNPQVAGATNVFEGVRQPFFIDTQSLIEVRTEPSTRIVKLLYTTDLTSSKKDIEPYVYDKLKQWFENSRKYSEDIKVFQQFENEGITTFKMINNIIPKIEDYNRLRAIASDRALDPNTINIKRKEFNNGDITLFIWARNALTGDKVFINEFYIPKGGSTVIDVVSAWINSN